MTNNLQIEGEFFSERCVGTIYICPYLGSLPDPTGDIWLVFWMDEDSDHPGAYAINAGSRFFHGFKETDK